MKTARYAFFAFAAFLVLSFMSSSFIPRTHAWAQLGCKWDHNGITYFNGASNVENSEVSMAAEAWSDTPTLQYMINVGTQQGANIAYSSVNDPNGGYTGVTTPAPCNNGLYNGQTTIQLNDPVLNGQPQDQIINSAAHETGHGWGLAHSQVNAALMWFSVTSYTSYGIIVPVIDDIRGAAQLYGWAADTGFSFSTTTGTGHFSGFNYPITLGVNSGCPGVCYAQGGTSAALPGSRIAVMSAYVRPLTLYRFHIGWEENSADPTDQSHRYATVEFDNDGGRLVYDKGGSLVSVPLQMPGGGSPPGINTNTSYFLEIVVEQNGGNANSVNAEVYAFQGNMQTGNGGEGFQGSINLDQDVSCLFSTCSLDSWGSANLFDIGSWVDSSSNPLSNYAVDHFWNFQGAVPKTPLAGTDFSLTSNGNSITLPVQQSGTFTLTATGLSVYAGTVTLTTAVSSPTVSASFNPTEIAVNQGAQGTSTLTVSGTASGTYTVTVTGTSVGISHSVSLTVVITDFTVSASPGSQTVAVGTTATTSVTVAAVNGFTGTVNLLLSSVPAGVSCTGISTSSYTPVTLSSTTTSASVNLSCTSSTAGTYQVGIYACYNCFAQNVLFHTTTATFTFAPPDFTISATSPAPVNVGSSTTSTITISPLYGFTGTVTLTDTVPSGVTCGAISPSTITGSGTAAVSCNATAANNYAMTITGTSGTLTHSATATFSFVDFSISVVPNQITIFAGSTASATININSLNGFTGTINLASGPASANCSLNPTSVILGANTSAALSCPESTGGQYVVTVTGTSGQLSHTTTVKVTIQDFSISSVGPQNVIPEQANILVGVTSINGYTGTVALSTCCLLDTMSGLPASGITFTFSPSSVTLTANATTYVTMTVVVAQNINVEADSYILLVQGTSAGVTRTHTYSVYPADFFLSASPTLVVIQSGSSGTTTLSVQSLRFYASVTLGIYSTSYYGLSPSLNPSQLNLVGGYTNTSTLTVSAANVPAGNYTITVYVQGTLGSTTLVHTFTINIQVKDFSVTPTPWAVTIPAGRSGTLTVNVASLNGFSGTVSLTPISLPSCVTATFNPSQVKIQAAGTNSSTLTLALAPSCTAATATYMYVQGTSGPGTHASYVSITVADYHVTESPSPVGIALQKSGSVNVNATGANGYPVTPAAGTGSELTMSVSGLPSGVTPTFNGATTITVTAQSINDTVSQRSVGLTFDQSLPFSFWTALPASVIGISNNGVFSFTHSYTLLTGSHTVEVGISAWTGYYQLNVYVNGVLAGSAVVNINTHVKVTLTASQTATLNLSLAKGVVAGRYSVTVTATDGIVSRSTVFDLRIGSFAISASPNPTIGGIGAASKTTVSISPFYGSTDTVSLTASFTPSACVSSYTFGPSSISFPAGGTSILTINTSSSCTPGIYSGTITATGKNTSNSTSFTFQVLNFTMTASSYYVTTPQGTATGDSITVAVTGASATVNISATISPSTGTWTSIFYPTLQVSSGGTAVTGMQIAATCNAPPGNYTVTVTGAIGASLSQSLTIKFTVTSGCTGGGGGGGGGSVAYGSLITLADGSQIPVQNLKVGDVMLGYDPTTGQFTTSTVVSMKSVSTTNMMIIHTQSGTPFRVDANPHQTLWVKTPDGETQWMPVTLIQPGDDLLTPSGWTTVTSIEFAPAGQHTMFDIVATMPYFADNYLDPIVKT